MPDFEQSKNVARTKNSHGQGGLNEEAVARFPEARDGVPFLERRGVTIWLTGLSGAGKTTLALAIERRLCGTECVPVVVDGDAIRRTLNKDLGFSPRDRSENIRRIAELARLLTDAGLTVIVAVISPYRDDRKNAAATVGEGRFAEVFVDAPIEICEKRDPKGMYKRARQGLIPEFTGVSAPYEAPTEPAVHVCTDTEPVVDCVERVLRWLENHQRAGVGAAGRPPDE